MCSTTYSDEQHVPESLCSQEARNQQTVAPQVKMDSWNNIRRVDFLKKDTSHFLISI